MQVYTLTYFSSPISKRNVLGKLNAILVEYAGNRAAMVETANNQDGVDGVAAVVHRDNDALAFLLGLGCLGLWVHGEVALQCLLCGAPSPFPGESLSPRTFFQL